MDWNLFAWLKRGNRRKSILELLNKSNQPLTADDVKKYLKIALSQASITLKELREKKLIDCLNLKDKIGKLYSINQKGKQFLQIKNGKK